MGYDIYGNRLRDGHCEVHPHVHEEYPCSVCMAEKQSYSQQQDYDKVAELEHYLGQAQQEIERLQRKCDYKDEVIEQRNAECSRQFSEIERLQDDLFLEQRARKAADQELIRLRAALERIGDMPIGRGLDPAAREALKLCAEIAREALQEGEK